MCCVLIDSSDIQEIDKISLDLADKRGARSPHGGVNKFIGGAKPYAPYNMEHLINKSTDKFICFYSIFKIREAWNKEILLKGGVVEKKLRTTDLATPEYYWVEW